LALLSTLVLAVAAAEKGFVELTWGGDGDEEPLEGGEGDALEMTSVLDGWR